jgi:large subunit ribosomal protein L13
VDCGDYVVVSNSKYVQVTGNKREQKIYKWHSTYPGGLKEVPFNRFMEKHPTGVSNNFTRTSLMILGN